MNPAGRVAVARRVTGPLVTLNRCSMKNRTVAPDGSQPIVHPASSSATVGQALNEQLTDCLKIPL
jgi:hypothetical protein